MRGANVQLINYSSSALTNPSYPHQLQNTNPIPKMAIMHRFIKGIARTILVMMVVGLELCLATRAGDLGYP